MRAATQFLFTDDHHESASWLTVRGDIDQSIIEVTMHGAWNRQLQVLATTALGKCFATSPLAVLVDLHQLADPSATSAATWWTAGMRGAALDPPVRVALCLPSGAPLTSRLRRFGAKWSLPMFATTGKARQALASGLPLTEREQLRLEPTADAASLARELVGRACAAWSMTHLLQPARRVTSELALNAVEHVGAPIVVTVSKRGEGLHLAVADPDPRLPRLIEPAAVDATRPLDERGHGLRVVQATATVWGATPTRNGKVVWALVRSPARDRRGATPRTEIL